MQTTEANVLIEFRGETDPSADRHSIAPQRIVKLLSHSLRIADQRADDYRALLRQAADIMDMEGIGEELVADIRATLSK